jgi:hypothetical protein
VSPSALIIGGSVYDTSAVSLSLQHSLTHYDPQPVLLSSSSSSLSSSNLPVDLSSLASLHNGSTHSLVSLSGQHHHPRIQRCVQPPPPTLISSPTVLMGPASSLTLSQPADLITASSHPLGVTLSGYPAQYTPFPQQNWPQPAVSASYPFTIAATATPIGHDATSFQRTHSASDRGDESPMVGVCIQQSPVAIH